MITNFRSCKFNNYFRWCRSIEAGNRVRNWNIRIAYCHANGVSNGSHNMFTGELLVSELFQWFQGNHGVYIEPALLLAWQLHSQFSWTHGCHSWGLLWCYFGERASRQHDCTGREGHHISSIKMRLLSLNHQDVYLFVQFPALVVQFPVLGAPSSPLS